MKDWQYFYSLQDEFYSWLIDKFCGGQYTGQVFDLFGIATWVFADYLLGDDDES